VAGVAELLDENVLRPGASPDWSDDIEEALARSQQFAANNIACGQSVLIEANPKNHPAGDFVVAWLESSTDRNEAPLLYDDAGRCNTLIVRGVRNLKRGNPVPLWFSPILGIGSAEVISESRATLDQRVYGFRPQSGGAIPVVPLAVLAQGSEEGWFEQSQTTPIEEVNDRYTVDYRTGVVTEGADGIPEIELKAPMDSELAQEGNFLLLDFAADSGEQKRFARQLEVGLLATDLIDQGGQLALDPMGRLPVPGVGVRANALAQLRAIVGENRVWPLFTSRVDDGDDGGGNGEGKTTAVLTGFAAGRIVDVRINENEEAVVLVQASTLVTATALVRDLGPNEQPNTWIARLCLTQ